MHHRPNRTSVWAALSTLPILLLAACGSDPSSVQAAESSEVLHHLFDHEPQAVSLGGEGIPAALAQELGQDTVWIRGEKRERDDWQVDMGAMDRTDGPLALIAYTELPMVGAGRRVRWRNANTPKARASDDTPDWEVLEFTPTSMRTTTRGPGIYPPKKAYSYEASTTDLRARFLGSLPSPSDWHPQRLELQRQTRRTVPAPAPARLTWRTQVPENGLLRLGYGLRPIQPAPYPKHGGGVYVRTESEMPDAAEAWADFRVGVRREGDSADEIAWEARLAGSEAGAFHSARVDLSAWAGEFVEIALLTGDDGQLPEQGLLPFLSEPTLEHAQPQRPNVLLIVADTLRADVLTCYGNPRPITPNIDWLAENGVRYDDVMSAATWTLPSHVSLLSSLYPTEHGVQSKERVPAALNNLPKVLRRAGYSTHALTEGVFLTPRYGLDQGFDDFQVGTWRARKTFGKAKELIDERDGPWFLYLHTYQPHAPYISERYWREKWVSPYDGPLSVPIRNGDWTRLEGVPSDEDMRFIREMYEAEVAYVDDEIGKLLRHLMASGQTDNLLIALTSDHGESFDEHGIWGHGTSAYQEQLRVPWILHHPRLFNGGLVVQDPVHLIDVAPTLLSAIGVGVPGDWSGLALDPFPGPDAADRLMFTGFLTQPWRRPATVLRQGRYKHILFPAAQKNRADDTTARMTFDLEKDPGEEQDIWQDGSGAAHFDLPGHLVPDLSVLHKMHPARFETQAAPSDAAVSAELETLGYAGEQD